LCIFLGIYNVLWQLTFLKRGVTNYDMYVFKYSQQKLSNDPETLTE